MGILILTLTPEEAGVPKKGLPIGNDLVEYQVNGQTCVKGKIAQVSHVE